MTSGRIPVLVDTDIGTDVDDLLALLAIFGDPRLELVGITTTYGDTVLRARIAKQVCDWAGIDVPIGAGNGVPLSGRDVWLAGHEGLLVDTSTPAAHFQPESAAAVISRAVQDFPDNLHVIAIGPLTNIPAVLNDVGVGRRLAGIAVMGGDFAQRSSAEHNFISDAEAAHTVMESDAAIRVIGVDQTRRIRVHRDQVMDAIEGPGPLRVFTRRETQRWMDFNREPFVLLHDPLTTAMMTDPGAFTFVRGRVDVCARGAVEGVSGFEADSSGSTEIVLSLDEDVLRSMLLQLIADGLKT